MSVHADLYFIAILIFQVCVTRESAYQTYLGGDIKRTIGDVQVPDDEDEAGRHAGVVHEVRRAVNGTVVNVVRRRISPEASVLALTFIAIKAG
jgi:hypothetical protein